MASRRTSECSYGPVRRLAHLRSPQANKLARLTPTFLAPVEKNKETGKDYTAAQALHRMTEGMENLHSPPNGPGRPTLTTKWCARVKGVTPEAVKVHVEALRQHLAGMIEEELREQEEPQPPQPQPQPPSVDFTGDSDTDEPSSKRQRGNTLGAASS